MKNNPGKEKKYIFKNLIMAALFIFNTAAMAQLITSNNAKYGLLDKAGNKILETECDEIKPLNEDPQIYLYKKNNKYGLYDFTTSKLYACEFDEVEYSVKSYKIRKGNSYGYIVCQYKGGKDLHCIVEPQYDDIQFSHYDICVKKDSFYGLISNTVQQEVLVPLEMEFPIEDTYNMGYVLRKKNGKNVYLRKDELSGKWMKIEMEGVKQERKGDFILDYAEGGEKITFYENKTCKKLSEYFFEKRNTLWLEEEFNEEFMGMERKMKSKEGWEISWFNPYTGAFFYQQKLSANERLVCEKNYAPRYTSYKEVKLLKGRKTSIIAVMDNYTVKPLQRAIVYRQRNQIDFSCDPFGCGDFEWGRCFFWTMQ